MANKFKPISISLSPNVQKDDVALAWKLLFQPWKWKQGNAIKKLEEDFKKYLGVKYAVSFNSGRSSLYAILKALNLPKESKVGLQAFTCNAVPNPILWAGLNPVYIDCANDFNIDTNKIPNNLSALIVQHTFGLPADTQEIQQTYQGIIIEDFAHTLGKDIKVFGDAAFFSFSRDKVISCVYGGMAVTNNPEIAEKLAETQKEFGMPGLFWIKQQILHPLLLHHIILPLYHFIDLGKLFLIASQWLHVLSKAVSWQEKRGLKPDYFPKALPNAQALMALNQFKKLDNFNNHRKNIAEFYFKELVNTQFVLPKNDGIFLRFAVQHPKAHEILYEAWHQQNMLLGDWYRSPVDPRDTQLPELKYEKGMCQNAERLSKITLNLPTHINISLGRSPATGEATQDAQRIVNFLKKWS
jgi:perosamine synthetase